MITAYTALTIGPIYKTLSAARKTRELWGGSYLFSYIMRRIIEELKDTSKCCLPYHIDLLTIWKQKGAGLFPDRLIYEGDVKAAIEKVEATIIKEIADKSGLPEDYLQDYIRINVLIFSLPINVFNDDSANPDNQNIVMIANKLLDTFELKEKHYRNNILGIDWKKGVDKINGQQFYKEAFGKDTGFHFPSIAEIATDDFRQQNENSAKEYNKLVSIHLDKNQEESDQNAFLKALKGSTAFGDKIKLRPYHKYIAVVQADGDNIGKTIGKIGGTAETVRKFSAALFDFAIAATEKIKSYGGKAVYVGGDDLLFFAPVAVFDERLNEGAGGLKSIFGLINDIDAVFEQKIIANADLKHLYKKDGVLENDKPSMSYGVSITFSKYPLNEARDGAYALLNEAKKIKNDKDKICFKLHKHSGQNFGFTIDKKERETGKPPKSFDYFISLVNNIPLKDDLLLSISTKLAPLHILLNTIASEKERLDAFFDQEFELEKLRKKFSSTSLPNDVRIEAHTQEMFINTIVNYYYQLAVDFPNDNLPLPASETEQSKSNIAKLYSTLRFIKHLTDEENER